MRPVGILRGLATSTRRGQVLTGANNIYRVRLSELAAAASSVECRIKGKVLGGERAYNPLAAGDFVAVELESGATGAGDATDGTDAPAGVGRGRIVERLPRATALSRWNRKRGAVQTLAANADLLLAVSSYAAPPFRPRFLDRLALSAELGGIEPVLVINKADLAATAELEDRLAAYDRLGYRWLRCSALTGEAVDAVAELIREARLAIVAGQSGVGKTALLNRLDPDLRRREGAVSRKYNRGAHTTTFAELIDVADVGGVIDTPGIRELEITGIHSRELRLWFRDLEPFVEQCALPGCLCVEEPGCAVRDAVAAGQIHPDRYESYLRTLLEMQEAEAAASAAGVPDQRTR